MILERPRDAFALYLLAHGAGAGMRHPFLEALAQALSLLGVATLRYEFGYMERGERRIDAAPVLEGRVRSAVAEAAHCGLPLFAGGRSMGGRITSQAAAAGGLEGVRGIAFVGFPLHPVKKPGVARAAHLREVPLPMLFLQGTRDALADLELLRPIVSALPQATLHVIDGADHSFHVRKQSGRTDAQVVAELSQVFARWARAVLQEEPPA